MKKLIFYFVIIFILVQFIPVNLPETSKNNPDDLITTAHVPPDVAKILKTSCYDCHSNETVYPWYSHVVPISFLVKRDIEEGKEELNFSEWNKLKKSKKAKKLDEISEEISEDEMPMKIYTIIHRDAVLSEKQKEKLINWAENYAESLFSE